MEKGYSRKAMEEVHRGKEVRKEAKAPITTITIRITSTSDEKSHVNPLTYTSAKKTARQSTLFMVAAPYNCSQKKKKKSDKKRKINSEIGLAVDK